MKKHLRHDETYEFILELFTKYIDNGLKFVHKKCNQMINQVLSVYCVFLYGWML